MALAAFEYNFGKVNAIIDQEMSRHNSAREKLLVYGKVYSDFIAYPFPAGGCPVLNTAIEADDTHPELKKKVMGAINAWKKKIISILETGVEHKEFSRTIDTEQIALTIIALIEGGIMISKVTGKTNYRLAIMTSLEAYIKGIK